RSDTLSCNADWTLANTALMTVLSRNVKKRMESNAANPKCADRARILGFVDSKAWGPKVGTQTRPVLLPPLPNRGEGHPKSALNYALLVLNPWSRLHQKVSRSQSMRRFVNGRRYLRLRIDLVSALRTSVTHRGAWIERSRPELLWRIASWHRPALIQSYFLAGALKIIGPEAVSPPEMLPALSSHLFKFDVLVPQVLEPTLPVVTLNLVLGNLPLALMVAVGGAGAGVLHPAWPLAVR